MLAAIILSGCVGALVPIEDSATMSSAQRGIAVTTAAPPQGARIIGSVTGHSCKNKAWNPAPTRAAADDQLRLFAAQQGASGVGSVTYQERGTTFSPNCWSSITATGVAYAAD